MDSVEIQGQRKKKNLVEGGDSLSLALAESSAWVGVDQRAALSLIHRVNLGVTLDMPPSNSLVETASDIDSLQVSLKLNWDTDSLGPLPAQYWQGAFDLKASQLRMVLQATEKIEESLSKKESRNVSSQPSLGHFYLGAEWELPPRDVWKQPEAWVGVKGRGSARSENYSWDLGGKVLPLVAEIPTFRCDSGWLFSGDLITRDTSRLAWKWSAKRPKRIDFEGSISPTEAWALAWTKDHVGFKKGRVSGYWEGKAGEVSAWVDEPRAYGAEAEKLFTRQRINTEAYYLDSAVVWHGGNAFRGSGNVAWPVTRKGGREAQLYFEFNHPQWGTARYTMPPCAA
jgi:hypothetical protein